MGDSVAWGENFTDPDRVLRECHRVTKPEGRLALTTTFRGHMAEFYDVFQHPLRELGPDRCLGALASHLERRSDLVSVPYSCSQ